MVSEPETSTRKKSKPLSTRSLKTDLTLSPSAVVPVAAAGALATTHMTTSGSGSGSSLRNTLIIIGVIMILAGYGYAGYIMYQRLQSIEREIKRAKQSALETTTVQEINVTEDVEDTEVTDADKGDEVDVDIPDPDTSKVDFPRHVFEIDVGESLDISPPDEPATELDVEFEDKEPLLATKFDVEDSRIKAEDVMITPPPAKAPSKRGRPRKHPVVLETPQVDGIETLVPSEAL